MKGLRSPPHSLSSHQSPARPPKRFHRAGGSLPHLTRFPQSVSIMQDSAASAFKEFRNLLHLVRRNSHFYQCLVKVLHEPVEMPLVEPLPPRLRMGSGNILPGIY